MAKLKIVPYERLSSSDLIVDAVYEGLTGSGLKGEALSRLLEGVGNQGGFRASGRGTDKKFVVLFTSGADPDWPDTLDSNTGLFQYFGDNKQPGHQLHDTRRGGNRILRTVFDYLHASPPVRGRIPPFLVFQRYPTSVSARSFQFKGLAAPGFPGLPPTADLIAVWKSAENQRFQNYKATFTILDAQTIPRAWLEDVEPGKSLNDFSPGAWRDWVETGRYRPLMAVATTNIRSADAQRPDTPATKAVLQSVWRFFENAPHAFEVFAAQIFQMHDQRVIVDEITRATVDGGRDAVGRYLLGLKNDPVYAEFALEAKCYDPALINGSPNTVGVREVSRLISRIRHREFGVLVTTSLIARQAYEEVRHDKHPIIFISGRDIAEILIANGFGSPESVVDFLEREFGDRLGRRARTQ